MAGALLLIVGGVLLYGCAEALVRGAASLGLRSGLSPLVVGLTVVAFGTSAPELAVCVQAALDGQGGIALGNVVGSNICNVALILGASALIRPVAVHAQLLRVDVPLMVGASVLLCALLVGGRLGRFEGAMLLLGIVVYLASNVVTARRESQEVKVEFGGAAPTAHRSALLDLGLVGAGIIGLVIGAQLFVRGAVEAAAALGVPPAIVGLTVVAIGTSLPELATSVVAALRAQGDIAIGNVVGSNLFNILGILGSAALVAPIEPQGVRWADLGAMVAIAVALLALVLVRSQVERWAGAALLVGYAVYLGALVA